MDQDPNLHLRIITSCRRCPRGMLGELTDLGESLTRSFAVQLKSGGPQDCPQRFSLVSKRCFMQLFYAILLRAVTACHCYDVSQLVTAKRCHGLSLLRRVTACRCYQVSRLGCSKPGLRKVNLRQLSAWPSSSQAWSHAHNLRVSKRCQVGDRGTSRNVP
jgi:hypothetical protein